MTEILFGVAGLVVCVVLLFAFLKWAAKRADVPVDDNVTDFRGYLDDIGCAAGYHHCECGARWTEPREPA